MAECKPSSRHRDNRLCRMDSAMTSHRPPLRLPLLISPTSMCVSAPFSRKLVLHVPFSVHISLTPEYISSLLSS